MSSLLRSEALSVIDSRRYGSGDNAPRIFGARVLRGDNVGMDRPISLSVPSLAAIRQELDDIVEEVGAPAAPPDPAEIEEAARLQGYNIGYEQGQAAGYAAAEQATAELIARLSGVVAGVHENHQAFFRAAERQVVDLALQIAGKVVERELENMPDLAVNVIRSALEEMDARTAVRVRVNPSDFEVLQRRWHSVVPSGVSAERIELSADDRVQPGGGVIETTHGQVDAQLDTKLAQLGNALWTFVMDTSASAGEEEAFDA